MAHDNVLFIVDRKIFEVNKVDNKSNILIKKKKKNFPLLSRMDSVKELSERHFQYPKSFRQATQSFQNNRTRLLTGQEVTFAQRDWTRKG
jgi:hypothetical protein